MFSFSWKAKCLELSSLSFLSSVSLSTALFSSLFLFRPLSLSLLPAILLPHIPLLSPLSITATEMTGFLVVLFVFGKCRSQPSSNWTLV